MGKFAITAPAAQDYASKQAVLEAAFAMVANPSDWRAAIDAEIVNDPGLREMVADAIIHFTATEPTFTFAGPHHVRVQAVGYRAGPAGP